MLKYNQIKNILWKFCQKSQLIKNEKETEEWQWLRVLQ